MTYASVQEIGGICTTSKQASWKLAIAMDHGLEKRLDGQKVITGHIRSMSWYVSHSPSMSL